MRAALYCKVSSEEQVDGFSLDAQVRAIEAHCLQAGHEIVERYRDEGKSARSDDLAKRPAFARMIEDAELGRFARNLRLTLEILERLERAASASSR